MKRFLCGLLLIVFMSMWIIPITSKAASKDEILTQINAAREAAGLSSLAYSEDLEAAATIRAEECASSFSHIRPCGSAWYTVGFTRGENLAHAENENQRKAENVVLAWLLSPKHKENVLRSCFTSVGVSYYSDSNGETYIACEFN
ncbi:CAP domain-containing protein [Butyrivibrio sp.]|uniref:CAP domain-containing protein n=1 Tax=Butyrivibrio sp. TaxID=28121 RepID=UPI0025C39531|nr:CAP domain-containing protein [Butyrivibrio sp.]MBQ9301949.1 CAP domain-containing protein [Butyrivibrio sp.]